MNSTTVDVASIGTLAVDYFGILEEMPALDDKTMAIGYEVHPGGVAGNVITQIARLGIRTGWLGKIGDDATGSILVKEFEKDGIDGSHAEIVPGKNSMFTWIMIDGAGHRTITMFPNVLNEFSGADVREKHRDYIASAQVLMAEACVLPLEPDIAAMEIARESDTMVVFDLDVTPSGVEQMRMGSKADMERAISLSDVFIPCKAAASELLGTDDIVGHAHELLDLGPKTVAVTLGERGCIVLNEHERHVVSGFSVDVVDSTGAGDAFHGGFVYGLLKGFSLEETARFANACGALNCEAIGARASAPLSRVEMLIRSQR